MRRNTGHNGVGFCHAWGRKRGKGGRRAANPLPAGPPGRWTVEVPGWHPTRVNRLLGAHPMSRGRLKRADYDMIMAYCRLVGVTRAAGRRRLRAWIVLGPRMRFGDPDGYLKSLLDGLVWCGALVDDSERYVAWERPESRGGEARATLLEIEDLEGLEGSTGVRS